ncbi:MAG: hypothetical protein ACRDIL_20710 [Candidatus Limnocylindrales bacterium]
MPTDPIAARVLLHVLGPDLRSLGLRLAPEGPFDDLDRELLSVAWERIRTYPISRRPSAIAANVLLDVRKDWVRSVAGSDKEAISLEALPAHRWPTAPSAEHEALEAHFPSLGRTHGRLLAAVESGAFSPVSARVVWRTRILQDDDARIAGDLGVAVRTLQRRRQRAERQLASVTPRG